MKRDFLLAAALLLLAAVPSMAQYRANLPPTLTPPAQPRTDVTGIEADFRRAYAAHGKPRIVIFWNRDFSAQVATSYDHYSTSHSQTRDKDVTFSDTAASDEGQTTLTKHEGGAETNSEGHSGIRATDNGAAAVDSNDTTTWEAEGAFTDSFTAIPTRLIDRAAIIRSSPQALAASEGANVQAIEAAALNGKADLILETMANPDPNSLSGYTFKVEVKDVKSGASVLRFVTNAVPIEASQVHYVAGQNGFVRAAPVMTVGIIGHQLALETMQKLTAIW